MNSEENDNEVWDEDSYQEMLKECRASLLEDLAQHESFDFVKKVRWLTARDDAVCPLCREREGKTFTFKEIRKILQGDFCRPADTGDRCRCCFVADENSFSEE